MLQEYVQKNKIGKISYKQVDKKGFEHKPTFGVELLIDGKVIAKGEGAKKQLAEMQAAEKGLKILKKENSKKQTNKKSR